MARDKAYELSVFVNCPFDRRYRTKLLSPIIFTIFDCGYEARTALEVDNAVRDRLDKICRLIESSKYGIHDISRTALDRQSRLPRFNMPFELGLFLAAERFGVKRQKEKVCLVLDKDRYRYQKFLSDINGRDIREHRDRADLAIRQVRDWLNNDTPDGVMLPGPKRIETRHQAFRKQLPKVLRAAGFGANIGDLSFNDFVNFVSEWIKQNPKERS